jgi:hypothetical protein
MIHPELQTDYIDSPKVIVDDRQHSQLRWPFVAFCRRVQSIFELSISKQDAVAGTRRLTSAAMNSTSPAS